MPMTYPKMTVGELRKQFDGIPDDWTVDFSGLDFYQVKQRDEKHVQIEFNQQVYRGTDGRVVVENLGE